MVQDSLPDYDSAVQLVLGGMRPLAAWEASGKPEKDQASALSNIRKRVRFIKKETAA